MTTEPDRLEVMQALKPCPNPWCEGKAGVEISVHVSGRWHVCCDDCMIEGPWADTKAEAITAWNTRPIETNSRTGDTAEMGAAVSMSPDVIRLVIAARIVAFEDQSPEAMHELDKASEAFASRVPWDDEPAPAPQSITPPEVGGELERDEDEAPGWLIEESASGFVHWIALAEDSWPRLKHIWSGRRGETTEYRTPVRRVKDASEAVRFSRQQDAEAFIQLFSRFLLCPAATEHQWNRP